MKVILAKNAGFCMGVRRAVETTLGMVREADDGIATYGPLIHNPQVLDLLRERGVNVLDDIPAERQGTVIIRAHGVPPAQKDKLLALADHVEDATCPRVLKVQVIIKKHNGQGYATIIIGDKNHAEVDGLMGYAGGRGCVVSCADDIDSLDIVSPYIIVSQTTQDAATFEALSGLISKRFPGGKIFNTICDSTNKRQAAVIELCAEVEAMVVVGGKASANTQRLAEIVKGRGKPVFLVETEDDLDMATLADFDCVGITAGASTPSWMISRVIRALESIPGKDDSRVGTWLFQVMLFLLNSNIYVSIGGAMLVYASSILTGDKPGLNHFLIVFAYLFAMHNLNRFAGRKTSKINDPVKERFYRKYRWTLLISSCLALGAGLTLAYGMSLQTFYMLSLMSVLGILYNVRFIPRSIANLIKVRRLKEIPGSKTLFVATAWTFVIVLLPSWAGAMRPDGTLLWSFICVLLLVYLRCVLFDVFDVQGDRIVGKETLPVFIGERKTLTLLYVITTVLILLLVLLPVLGILSSNSFWLIPAILYLLGLTVLYDRGILKHGPRLEFGLDTVFFIAAALAWLGALA